MTEKRELKLWLLDKLALKSAQFLDFQLDMMTYLCTSQLELHFLLLTVDGKAVGTLPTHKF